MTSSLKASQQSGCSWKRGMCMMVCMFERMWVFRFFIHSCIWPQGHWNGCEWVCVSFSTALIRYVQKSLNKRTPWKLEVIRSERIWRAPLFSQTWQQPSAPLEYLYLQQWPVAKSNPSSRQGHSTSFSNQNDEDLRRWQRQWGLDLCAASVLPTHPYKITLY